MKKRWAGDRAGELSRRSFLKACAAAPLVTGGSGVAVRGVAVREESAVNSAAAYSSSSVNASTVGAQSPEEFVAIQVGAISFLDEGLDKVLDILQQQGGVNALMLAVFTYGRGIAGRQVPGQPLPDHGVQQYDTDTFHGGSYTAVHPRYFSNTSLRDVRAPDLGNFDVFEAVLPAARKRGLKTIAWFEDVFRADTPGVRELQERDLQGRNAT